MQPRLLQGAQRGEFLLVEAGVAWRSWCKIRVVFNRLQAFIHGQLLIDLKPRSRMSEVREAELAVADVFHPRKLRLEGGRKGVRAWTGVAGDEVEIAPVPFPAEVRDIVELCVWFGRLNVLRFQNILDQMHGLGRQFCLD